MAFVSIDTPQSGDTVTTLSFQASVSYNTLVFAVLPPQQVVGNQPQPPVITWQLTVTVAGVGATTRAVPAPTGTEVFDFTVPAPGDYTISAVLEKVTTPMGGMPMVEVIAENSQSPIHVTAGGGVIIVKPRPFGAPVVGAAAAAVAGGFANVPAPAPCPPPVLISGTFPSVPDDPTTGMVVEVYRTVNGNKVIDYVAIPILVGSTLVAGGGGAILVGNTFSVVLPPEARTNNRYYRLFLIGVLGKILFAQSSPVT